MSIRRIVITAAAVIGLAHGAQAEISNDVVKIGVLTDLSGPFAEVTGPGSVVAAQLAIEDFHRVHPEIKVELLSADHQNKADVASVAARRWKDVDGIDMIVDVPNSAVALAVNEVLRGTRVAFMPANSATMDLTGPACSPNTVVWTLDAYSLANVAGRAITRSGNDSWYFIAVNFAFGASLESEATKVIQANGGKVLGGVKHPLNTSDYSSFLLSAQSSGAKVIGLANVGADTVNVIKQAAEFGITRSGKQSLAALLFFINDVHALGLEATQNLLLTTGFYWDLNDTTRAWSKRYAEKLKGKMPSQNQAGVYSSVLAYLTAVAAKSSDDGLVVVQEMKQTKIEDPLFANSRVRVDGRTVHDMYLVRVKTPAESKAPWDYYNIVATVPGDEAFRPLDQGNCPLVGK